tara:strand:- start:1961 stop:2356 length:396 start_codon:yes stop_codon:yes gene_type:complete
MKDKVQKILSSKKWTFADLTNMSQLVTDFSEEIYTQLDAKEKLSMVWERDVSKAISHANTECSFGNFFSNIVMEAIKVQVANILQELLIKANVNFSNNENKEDEINEISERSLGGKSPTKRTANETNDSEE